MAVATAVLAELQDAVVEIVLRGRRHMGSASTECAVVYDREVADTLVFYDGLCGLCDKLVHFLLRHDRRGRLRFAQLQGDLACELLVPRGIDPSDLDTV